MGAILTEYDALLEDVKAAPLDDLPRLIAADWLEDHGQAERAEFVRVQVERAALQDLEAVDRMSGMARSNELGRRARRVTELCDAEAEWVRTHAWKVLRDELPPLLWQEFDRWSLSHDGSNPVVTSKRDDDLSLTFRRGFVWKAACTLQQWLGHGKELAARQPLETVLLTDRKPYDFGQDYEAPWHRFGLRIMVLPDDDRDFTLPRQLWFRLPDEGADKNEAWLTWREGAQAVQAISTACIRWARGEP